MQFQVKVPQRQISVSGTGQMSGLGVLSSPISGTTKHCVPVLSQAEIESQVRSFWAEFESRKRDLGRMLP